MVCGLSFSLLRKIGMIRIVKIISIVVLMMCFFNFLFDNLVIVVIFYVA